MTGHPQSEAAKTTLDSTPSGKDIRQRRPPTLRHDSLPSGIASIQTTGDFRILEATDAYRLLYDVDHNFVPETLQDAIRDRASRGWLGLAEILDERAPIEVRIAEIRSAQAYTTLLVSPHGDLIQASHIMSFDGEQFHFNYAATGYAITCPPETRKGLGTLLWLHDLLSLGYSLNSVIGSAGEYSAHPDRIRFLGDVAGNLLLCYPQHIQNSNHQTQSLEELGLPFGHVMDALRTTGRIVMVFDHPDQGPCLFSARRIDIFCGGSGFIVGQITPFAHFISPENVRAIYPKFTIQEAVAIAAIAQGKTIKLAANALGKSHVTLALQARSALYKTNCTSIEDLCTRIIVIHAGDASLRT